MKVCPSCGNTYDDDVRFCPDEGIVLVPLASADSGDVNLVGERLFGDYLLKKKLGEGGMGAVYLAENTAINQKIAVKVLHPESAANDEIVQRFNREASAIARLTHPNTIRVFIFGKTPDPLIYLAMEYVDGTSLRQAMADRGPFDELAAIAIMRQVLHALSEAHELGVVHRDMKPDNIMLTRFRGVRDFVKVLDFGIAKVTEQDGESQKKLTQAGVVYGTPEYLSPEQARGRNIDHRADLYALGIILYEMITAMVPFTGETSLAILSGHVYQEPPDPNDVSEADVSPQMRDIILHSIEKDPNERYQDAMEFLEALEAREREIIGGKSMQTTMLDVRETGMMYEAAKAAQRATQAHEIPAEDSHSLPTEIVKTPTTNPSPDALITESGPIQAGTIKRQKGIILGLAIAFTLMTALAVIALLTRG